MGDVEFAVQVIGLVQEGASQQIFSGVLESFAIDILCTNGHDFGARHVFTKFRNAARRAAKGHSAAF